MKKLISLPLLPSTLHLLLLLLLTSCEKEIDLDYHKAEPKYVVEASVSDSGTQVRISQTNAMDDNTTGSDVSDATVIVTDGEGLRHEIPYTKNGLYQSALTGEPGVTYQLDVYVDSHHFSSTSTMQRTPRMNSFRLVWQTMMTERILFGDLRLQDIPNESNWYFLHIYRNGIGYRWAVMKDDTNPNQELQQLFALFREGSSNSDVLREGDRLHILIRAIDQRAYDYLYSMQQMDNTGTNPIDNFTGGCLGYFTAYSQITHDIEYHAADTEEDE